MKIHRIIAKKASPTPRKGPVFFMHGLCAFASDYLMTGPARAFRELFSMENVCDLIKTPMFAAYLLSDNGYDVWLGNSRGTDQSQRHKHLSATSDEYWDFSFHEIGFFDVRAMIDFTLKKTKSPKLFYVGHSQGATAILVLLSMLPEYNQKILQAHLMAPASFMKNVDRLDVKTFEKKIDVSEQRSICRSFLNMFLVVGFFSIETHRTFGRDESGSEELIC